MDAKWQEHQKRAGLDLHNLMERQVWEMNELLAKLGLEEH